MLTSINPLGERARNNTWGVTATWYVAGTSIAGTAVGATLGMMGSLLHGAGMPRSAVLWVVVAVAGAGLALDLGLGGLRVPSIHRQVNEAWLDRYRSWVYGLGFGFQLGTGVMTIVTTAAIYATWAVAFLSGSVVAGGVIGLAFGATRGLVVLTVAGVRRPDQLRAYVRGTQRWAGAAGLGTATALSATALSAAAMAI